MLKYLKELNPNLCIIVTSIIITLWFKGLGMILNHFFPNEKNNFYTGLIMCGITLFVLWSDDGMLDEISKISSGKKKD